MAPDPVGRGQTTARAGEALLRLFAQTDDARLLLTPDGVVTLANPRCAELFGWSVDELVGTSAVRLTPERHREEYAALRDLVLDSDSGDAARVDLVGLHRDGTELRLRVTARAIVLGQESRILSLILQTRDGADSSTGFRDLLEAVPDGNVVVDGRGRILMANAPAQTMFGYREDELLDQPLELLVPEAQRASHVRRRTGFTGRARRHAMGLGTRVVAQRKDGSTFPVSVVISSIGINDDVLFSATVHDLSELEALRGRNDQLRDQFLATVSHELRTPLTTILASAEMLEDDVADLPDERVRALVVRYAERIERAARRELALVDDLLSLTIIEGDAERLGDGLADLTVVAESVVAGERSSVEARGLTISAVSAGHPAVVRAHEGWLERAVRCLVDNAAKFTPRGGRIEVVTGVEGDLAWLEVCDTGPGIPGGDEERVFARLYRGADAVAAETPGAGLGLSIARSIVGAAGGRLEVVPAEGGARLRITAPRAVA
ncbi:sensor histidine kinase [Nocardioides sp. URHA0020]|uniref:sensor histidine kinase n=1 Tax=Nocardioides sp. URHA0020 TaxID=1380392 RepID=UPI00049038F3|nr:PAS domain S-box protein [Nocardioides sp. URHA0020]